MSRFTLVPEGDWPSCLLEPGLRCGDVLTRVAGPTSAEDVEIVQRGWHVADMCNCPSCPLRVALSSALFSARSRL